MKRKYASILLTLIGVLGLGVAAQAQTGKVVVDLPFEFVASGKTLPAGTYTLSPVSDNAVDGLILSSYENHISLIVHPIETEKATAEKATVSFQQVGEQRFLNRIQTENTVYNIPVSSAAASQAAMQ